MPLDYARGDNGNPFGSSSTNKHECAKFASEAPRTEHKQARECEPLDYARGGNGNAPGSSGTAENRTQLTQSVTTTGLMLPSALNSMRSMAISRWKPAGLPILMPLGLLKRWYTIYHSSFPGTWRTELWPVP